MKSLNKQTVRNAIQRQQNMDSAVASVKAEGLTPTAVATKRMNQYVQGKLTADQLFQQTLAEVKSRSQQSSG